MNLEQISKSQFKAKALEFLRQVESTGQPVVVTDNGRPAIEVRRYRSDPRTPLERLQGTVIAYLSPLEKPGSDQHLLTLI